MLRVLNSSNQISRIVHLILTEYLQLEKYFINLINCKVSI